MPEPCPGFPPDPANGGLRAAPQPVGIDKAPAAVATEINNGSNTGPRKLVRPKLPPRTLKGRSDAWRAPSPMFSHQAPMLMPPSASENSNAEAYYFQKQMQTQTLMVIVLDNGERIEGYLEWYDRDTIKVKNGSRTLIYKSAIKYLYKAGEGQDILEGLKHAR